MISNICDDGALHTVLNRYHLPEYGQEQACMTHPLNYP